MNYTNETEPENIEIVESLINGNRKYNLKLLEDARKKESFINWITTEKENLFFKNEDLEYIIYWLNKYTTIGAGYGNIKEI